MDDLIASIAERLGDIRGVVAVALGGSRARGTDRPDSDADLGLYYRARSPFAIGDVRELAAEIGDQADPVVTDFGRWGRWVNGGAWLTVQGKHVDFLYRDIDDLERVIEDCRQGRIESDYYQQPPYGFHSYSYLGELSICRPLYDPQGLLAALKAQLEPYPQPLKKAIVDRFVWGAEFDLPQAAGFARRGQVYETAGCLTRVAAGLVQVVYALNERYFVADKGAMGETAVFDIRPDGFEARLYEVLARPGGTAEELQAAVVKMAGLLERVRSLCVDLYQRPDFRAQA